QQFRKRHSGAGTKRDSSVEAAGRACCHGHQWQDDRSRRRNGQWCAASGGRRVAQTVSENRSYPNRPFLAVSAAIIRDGRVLIVRRARPPAQGIYTLPGGVVEAGETLHEAVIREIREETSMTIEPVALAGHREAIVRDKEGRVERHFIILAFAA